MKKIISALMIAASLFAISYGVASALNAKHVSAKAGCEGLCNQ